jgi:hypothetical protein
MFESGSFYLMRNPTRKLIQKFKIAPLDLTFHPSLKKTPTKHKLIEASNKTYQ